LASSQFEIRKFDKSSSDIKMKSNGICMIYFVKRLFTNLFDEDYPENFNHFSTAL